MLRLPEFDFSNAETNSRIFGVPPDLSSRCAGWRGIYFERRHDGQFSTEPHVMQKHYLMVKLNARSEATRIADGRVVKEAQQRGSTAYVPHGCPHQVIYPKSMGELFFISLDPEVVVAVAEQMDPPVRFAGHPVYANSIDPLVTAIGLELDRDLQEGNLHGPLLADAAAHMLAAHLIRLCRGRPSTREPPARLRLSEARLRAVAEFVDANLDQPIRLVDMAAQAGLSKYHFCRAFRVATGLPPHRFVLARRIEVARQRLRNCALSIQEVAFSVGFADAGQFSKRFRKATGISPSEFRRPSRRFVAAP
jgi:AraC family transcriptional regulator